MTKPLLSALALLGALTLAACGDKEAACTDGDFQCDGDVLQECGSGGWEDVQDCSTDGMMCHAEMGHCMEMSDDSGGM
ncbi:MAG: hypothetical protein H6739_36685 [Alphaproteobacteria bacterium]|nr:hypothetical protein [Alphaproteobacteria bacterium]